MCQVNTCSEIIAVIVPQYIVDVLVADKLTSTPNVVVRESATIFVNRQSDLIPPGSYRVQSVGSDVGFSISMNSKLLNLIA